MSIQSIQFINHASPVFSEYLADQYITDQSDSIRSIDIFNGHAHPSNIISLIKMKLVRPVGV